MAKREDQDLKDLLLTETRRGKRPIDIEERRRRAELLTAFRVLLDEGSKDDFTNAIRALGLRDGSPAFEKAMEIWVENRGRR